MLFYSSVLGLAPQAQPDVAGPVGLVRSQVMRSADGAVRLALNVPRRLGLHSGLPQHVAFVCDDIVGLARRARRARTASLAVPRQLLRRPDARFDLDPDRWSRRCAALGLLYDRDAAGEFLHFYTATVGGIFFEVVERRGGYDGYGAANAPVRLAAQHRRQVG